MQRVRKAQSTDFYGPFLDQLRTRRQLPAPLPVSNRYGIVAVQSLQLRSRYNSRALQPNGDRHTRNHLVPEHRILNSINKLPIFLIDFDFFDFFDFIDFDLFDFCFFEFVY